METVSAFEEMNRRSELDRCFERAWERAEDDFSVTSVRRKLEEDKDVEDQQRREWDAIHAGLVGPPATQTQNETPATTASVPESGMHLYLARARVPGNEDDLDGGVSTILLVVTRDCILPI